jgi:hypothetical protein
VRNISVTSLRLNSVGVRVIRRNVTEYAEPVPLVGAGALRTPYNFRRRLHVASLGRVPRGLVTDCRLRCERILDFLGIICCLLMPVCV